MAVQRTYFDLRNMIPGYTFLSLVIAINFIPIITVLQLFGVSSILGVFIALISGPTLGFLINQSWWWQFHWRLVKIKWIPIEALIKKFNLNFDAELILKKEKEKKMNKQNIMNILYIYDYVLFNYIHSGRERSGLSRYLFARWDLLILLLLTKWSLILGILIGLFFRFLYEIIIFQCSFFIRIQENFLFFLDNNEFWGIFFLFVAACLLIYFLRGGIQVVINDYMRMHEYAINSLNENVKEDLRKIFPEDFFKKEHSNNL